MGITSGIGNNHFAPDAYVTRQDLITLAYNTLVAIKKTVPIQLKAGFVPAYNDISSVNRWAAKPVQDFLHAGIIPFRGDSFSPNTHATRGEIAELLYLLLK